MTAADMDVAGATEERLKRAGALLEGHFQLTSGLHSNRYVQCAKLLSHPVEAEAVSRALAERFSDVLVLNRKIIAAGSVANAFTPEILARAYGVPLVARP